MAELPLLPLSDLVAHATDDGADFCDNYPECPGYHQAQFDEASGVLTLTYRHAKGETDDETDDVDHAPTSADFVEVGAVVRAVAKLLYPKSMARGVLTVVDLESVGQILAEALDAQSLNPYGQRAVGVPAQAVDPADASTWPRMNDEILVPHNADPAEVSRLLNGHAVTHREH